MKKNEYIVNLSPVGLALISVIWKDFVEGKGKGTEMMFIRKSFIDGRIELKGENAALLGKAIYNANVWVPMKPLIMFHLDATPQEAEQEERKLIDLWASINEMERRIGNRSNAGFPGSFYQYTLEQFINQWVKNKTILEDMEKTGMITFKRDPILGARWPVWNFQEEEKLDMGITNTPVHFDPQEVIFLLKRFFIEIMPVPRDIRPACWELVAGHVIKTGTRDEWLALEEGKPLGLPEDSQAVRQALELIEEHWT